MTNRSSLLLLAGLLCFASEAPAQPALPPPPPLADREIAAYLEAAEVADGIQEGEARCLAYPELPRIGWPRSMVAARCAMQRAPRYSAAELSVRLSTREGRAEVSRSFDTLLRQHYSTPRQREQIFLSLEPFKSHSSLESVVGAWVKAEPNNPWAQLARGARLKGAAQDYRGTRFIQETGQADLRNARQLATAAVPHLERALALEPRLSPACVILVEAYVLAGSGPRRTVADDCLKRDPASYHVVMAWKDRVPVAQVEAHIQKRGEQNPLLPTIRAVIEGARYAGVPDELQPQVTAPLLHALRHGPNARMLNAVSTGYNQQGQTGLGLAYLSQAVRFDMGYLHYRSFRAFQNQIARPQWAQLDLKEILRVYPDDAEHARMLREVQGRLEIAERESRPPTAEEAEMAAFVKACSEYADKGGWMSPEELANDPMKHCDDEAIARWPNEVEAWRVRAEVLYWHKRPGFESAARRYLRDATPGSPKFYSYENQFKRWLGEL